MRYKELSFKSEAERLRAVRHIMENAEVVLPARVVRIRRKTIRVSLCKLKEQFFLVHEPRPELLLPRVWLVTIPGFALCEIPVGREMVVCNRRVRSVWVRDHELVAVCDYHGSGFRVFRGVFDRQLRPVPESLCIRFCPHCARMEDREVEGRVRRAYECRAFLPYASYEEEMKRRRSFKGMSMLCLEDWWWREYVRRHPVE